MTVNLIPNKEFGNMGYIRKLPFLRRSTIHTKTIPPSYSETAGPIHQGRQTLSILLKLYPEFKKGGVFVISACRTGPDNKVAPLNKVGNKKPVGRGTLAHKIVVNSPYFSPKKGYRGTTVMPKFRKINNKEILKERRKLKRLDPRERMNLVNNVLLHKRNLIGTRYKTPRNLVSAFGVSASAARTNPMWLRRMENLFYRPVSNIKKLRARTVPLK